MTMTKTLVAAALMALGTLTAQAQDCCQKKEAQDCCQMKKGNPTVENILTRTSIRKYQARAVEAGKIDTLLRAAMAAPTAMNKQPWHFVVVTDKEVLKAIGGERGAERFANVPLAIVVCGDLNKAPQGPGRDFWIQDTSAATENILLAAHAMGLGAVWTSSYPREQRYKEIQAAINAPEHIVPLCVVLIGYPDEQPAPKQKYLQENVTYNQFK